MKILQKSTFRVSRFLFSSFYLVNNLKNHFFRLLLSAFNENKKLESTHCCILSDIANVNTDTNQIARDNWQRLRHLIARHCDVTRPDVSVRYMPPSLDTGQRMTNWLFVLDWVWVRKFRIFFEILFQVMLFLAIVFIIS